MPNVAIVTDSTCDLSPEELAGLGVTMVPLKVLFGDETYLDWTQMRPEEFYERLRNAPSLPKTSQPSPADFLSAYRALAEQGHDSIVSIHLTSALSGTYESATMAAADSPVPVAVVDTKRVSQAVALVVREACAARDAGATHDEIDHLARRVSSEMRLFFVLDTLEYLVKGGRAGKAQGLAASLLSIKPVLAFNSEGIIEPFKKVKGRKKALAELAAHVAEDSRTAGHLRGSLLHACAEGIAADLESEIKAANADIELVSRGLVGSVIGTYAGPDAVGIAYYPAM